MDAQQHDKTFVTTFLLVLGFLGTFTVAISVIAGMLSAPDAQDTTALARVEERIKPVGDVITDENMLLAAMPAATATRAPMSGPEIVAKVCGACHTAGVLGAPKTGDKGAWASRGNLDQLVASAIKGKNALPPRGGDPSLSDDEVRASVKELLK